MKLSEKINLFNQELLISQRSIKDIIDASNFSRDNPDPEESLFINSFIVHSGLKINLEKIEDPGSLPFYRVLKKRKLKKLRTKMEELISVKNIMSLSISELYPLVEKISNLDYGNVNGNSKKKAEALPT